ncbi:hypothetical protein SAMN02745168_0616 [Papillibacter cinnamivorans DSM 12816]|uniref:Uncharacterized protein n=1 Tax=Papillibacter cinnamivorans DSM 12816 TaxID=1122930 RepID=A0A1W1YQ74_9FIRM|nr:hypothetical protein SAMN02745168_0616 [Papillibacter cinnamivorans DSM 12816]
MPDGLTSNATSNASKAEYGNSIGAKKSGYSVTVTQMSRVTVTLVTIPCHA